MFRKIFDFVNENECSDLHLSAGNFPIVRIKGILQPIEGMSTLSSNHIDKFIREVLSDSQYEDFKDNKEVDFSLNLKNSCRFRGNAFKNSNGPAVALRAISREIKTLSDLNAPGIFKQLLEKRSGLIVVSGPTGCGKSTTLAAMVDYINQNHTANIITIEDPIEYVHKSNRSLISHREVGTHSKSFGCALRASLREDPDIILVGEMRDLETVSLALTAAETGHLVLTTLHTSSAVNAVSRIIDVFDSSEQPMIRTMLANSLNAVILQHLLPTKNNDLEAAFEVMIANPSIQNMIREDKLAQVNSMIEIGRKHGMITFKDSVKEMLVKGIISEEVAEDFLRTC